METLMLLAECGGAFDALAVCVRRLLDHGQKNAYEFDMDEVEGLARSCEGVAAKLHGIADGTLLNKA